MHVETITTECNFYLDLYKLKNLLQSKLSNNGHTFRISNYSIFASLVSGGKLCKERICYSGGGGGGEGERANSSF